MLLHSNIPGACIPKCIKCKNIRNDVNSGKLYCIYNHEYPTEPCQGFSCVDISGVPYFVDYKFYRDVVDAEFREIPNEANITNLESQRLDSKEFDEKDINNSVSVARSTGDMDNNDDINSDTCDSTVNDIKSNVERRETDVERDDSSCGDITNSTTKEC